VRLLAWWVELIARLVPAGHRAQWTESWLGELGDVVNRRGRGVAVRVARGAFQDALALRREITREQPARIRSLRPGVTWLDVKLAVRMLVRYPGLTAIGVIGMAVGIAIAAGAYGMLYTFIDPALPLDEGDRIVVLQNWDASTTRVERRTTHEFVEWRDGLASVQEIGAFQQVSRNLIAEGAQPETVRIAAITAAGFRVPRVQPLMGRVLLPGDEREGAPGVLVIGHEAWRSRFGSDPLVLGRTVQLGEVPHTIVGVMPEGFQFPVSHQYWIPLRVNPARHDRRAGPDLTIFGRLAPGATLESANAELALAGERAAAAMPQTHGQLRPRVLPYTYPFFDIDSPAIAWMVHLVQFLITLLLVIVCINVAILVYARTATRAGEIAVRTALGASRGRIVAQLFLEALVLSGVAAILGLAIAEAGLKQIHAAMLRGYAALPFWWTFGLSPGAVLYVVGLTVLAATIVGIVPALKATGPRMQGRLKSMSAGSGGMQLGRLWTLMIVGQVAFAVALLPAAVYHAWDSLRTGTAHPGFAAEQFLTTQLLLDRGQAAGASEDPAAVVARYGERYAELVQRLEGEAQVEGVTFSTAVPGEEATVWIEIDGVRSPTSEEAQYGSGHAVRAGSHAGHEVRLNRVGVNYFDLFDVPLVAGRSFQPGDANPFATAVIVNKSFARLLGAATPVGRQFRYIGRTNDAAPEHVEFGRWYEVVGVVSDFPNAVHAQIAPGKVYHASTPAAAFPAQLSLRVRGEALSFAGRLRELAAAVDPRLQLRDLMSMDDAVRREQAMLRMVAAVLVGLTAAVLLLSSAGVYAMMSFTIAQRRREIGIRTALGADQRQILAGIFSRALAQLAAGALIGVLAAILLEAASEGDLLQGHGPIVLPAVAAFMMVVGLLAALGPARRGLRIQPTEALREQ
jgi:putative ABC transport system permease protein